MACETRAICRDCAARLAPDLERCTQCAGPRILVHNELDTLDIAHVDCDAFFAAIEKRDRPELQDRPVIVGGGRRGVVSTACYIARLSGVHSAMPMFKALQACPDAVVIRPDMDRYIEVSRQLRDRMERLTPAVEPLSIDEAFLDLSGTRLLHRACAAQMLVRLASQVEKELKITISVGLAPNRFLAKMASDLDKPRGFSVIGRRGLRQFLAPRPVSAIWGVGQKMEARLERDGITRLRHLQDMGEDELVRRYGIFGQRLARLSRGEDSRMVRRHRMVKSIGHETTFASDIRALEPLRAVARRLSEKVARRLKHRNLAARTVTLKLKCSQFKTITRSRRLREPTRLSGRIFAEADRLLAQETGTRSWRLLGVQVSHLVAAHLADPPDLADPDAMRHSRIESAVDELRAKFGEKIVETGLTHKAGSQH